MPPSTHVPVLADETLALLAPAPGDVAVDGTLGRGGHATRLARAIGPDGLLVGFDLDRANLEHARERVAATGTPFAGHHESFVRMPMRVRELGRRANVVLADLGFASNQMDDPARGFSFRHDGPLDMRFDADPDEAAPSRATMTATELIATATEAELADLIFTLGEEPLARKIARILVRTREREPIESTAQLAGLVLEAYGRRAHASRMHPATRTFMALRIAVNEELESLRFLLEAVQRGAERIREDGWIDAGARVAIISFHSLEDRLVKRAFAELAQRGLATRLTKKPVVAGAQEVHANARARSARLRAIRVEETPGA
jgi:16S rRNA (cytosine1402-N4)-methyltransferase